MSLHAACTPQTPVLMPDLSRVSWSEPDGIDESLVEAQPPLPIEPESRDSTESWSQTELLRLAQDFLERSGPLIDAVAPPAWEDEDDLFDGEPFDDERAEHEQRSASNLSQARKHALVQELMANEAARYPGCSPGFLIALALTYRRILTDRQADPRDKVEILRRVYSRHEPQWMTAEIVYLHLIPLEQCRHLGRPCANVQRKEEILRWVFTDPELEDRPFSFKNCVKLVSGNTPEFGSVHQRLKEALQPVVAVWLRESLARKRAGERHQSELFADS